MRHLRALLACLFLLLVASPSARAAAPGRRVAVVVGVARYGAAGDLSSPIRNAETMAATLGRLGYEVRVRRDGQAADIFAAVAALRLRPADSFAFFFSGHGVTANGGAALAVPSPGGAIGLLRFDAITGLVAAAKPMAALYMLDACRSDAAILAGKGPLAADAPGPAQPPKTLGAFFAYGAVTFEAARAVVRDGVDRLEGVYVRVDGADVPLAGAARAGTLGCEPLAVAGSTTPAFLSAMDGIWLMLEPLPPGRHVLAYGSGTGAGGPAAGQVQDTTYDLDVR